MMLLLCIFGAVKEFRPTEPYIYEYEHTVLNISEHTLNSQVSSTPALFAYSPLTRSTQSGRTVILSP